MAWKDARAQWSEEEVGGEDKMVVGNKEKGREGDKECKREMKRMKSCERENEWVGVREESEREGGRARCAANGRPEREREREREREGCSVRCAANGRPESEREREKEREGEGGGAGCAANGRPESARERERESERVVERGVLRVGDQRERYCT